MESYQGLTYITSLCFGRKTSDKYIHTQERDPFNLSSTKKQNTKTAIVWLLSKAPHSVGEIADHFAINPKLVTRLLGELLEKGTIKKKRGNPIRYTVNEEPAKVLKS